MHLAAAAMLVRMMSRIALAVLFPLMLTVLAAAPADAGRAQARAQDLVREAVRRGEILPLEPILAAAQARHPGEVIEVEWEGDEYEIEILRPDGVVVELEYDARTGELREEEFEED